MVVLVNQRLTFRQQGMAAMAAGRSAALRHFVRGLGQNPRRSGTPLAALALTFRPVGLATKRGRCARIVRRLGRSLQPRQAFLEPGVLRFQHLDARKHRHQQFDQGRFVQRIKLLAIHEKLESVPIRLTQTTATSGTEIHCSWWESPNCGIRLRQPDRHGSNDPAEFWHVVAKLTAVRKPT
jgi:hypothetical protein